jgi:hypothetical protein
VVLTLVVGSIMNTLLGGGWPAAIATVAVVLGGVRGLPIVWSHIALRQDAGGHAMDDNPVERLLGVLPPDLEMPTAALVRHLVRHTPPRLAVGNVHAARKLVAAVASLAETAEEARLPLALPSRTAANRLAGAHHAQVLAWMRAANH